MKERLIRILFWALALHIFVSVAFIFNTPFLRATRLSEIYKTRLMPGPFFSESRIIDNYSFFLSWKVDGKWSSVINPVKDDVDQYHTSLNPSDLYRSRISRTLQLMLPDSSETDIKKRKEFLPLKQFLDDKYVPKEADSVRIRIVKRQAKNFMVRKDSAYIVFYR